MRVHKNLVVLPFCLFRILEKLSFFVNLFIFLGYLPLIYTIPAKQVRLLPAKVKQFHSMCFDVSTCDSHRLNSTTSFLPFSEVISDWVTYYEDASIHS